MNNSTENFQVSVVFHLKYPSLKKRVKACPKCYWTGIFCFQSLKNLISDLLVMPIFCHGKTRHSPFFSITVMGNLWLWDVGIQLLSVPASWSMERDGRCSPSTSGRLHVPHPCSIAISLKLFQFGLQVFAMELCVYICILRRTNSSPQVQ